MTKYDLMVINKIERCHAPTLKISKEVTNLSVVETE